MGPIFSGMIGGAIAGGIAGAFEGGLSGALHGAMWGGALGGIMGAGYQLFGVGFLVAGAIGGGIYAGIAGGGEGLANYAAGTLGAFYGASLGNALIGQSPVKTSEQGTSNNNLQQSPEAKDSIQKNQLQTVNDSIKANSPAEKGLKAGEAIAKNSPSGGASVGNTQSEGLQGSGTTGENYSLSSDNPAWQALNIQKGMHAGPYRFMGRTIFSVVGMAARALATPIIKLYALTAGAVALYATGSSGWAGLAYEVTDAALSQAVYGNTAIPKTYGIIQTNPSPVY